MRKRLSLAICCVFLAAAFSIGGCKKDNEVIKKQPQATSGADAKEANSQEVVATEEVPTVNIENLEKLKGISMTTAEGGHNIYKGMIGDEEVIVSIWNDSEINEANLSFVGAYHSDKLSFTCELQKDGIRYQDDKYYILLKQQKDDVMTGYFYEKGTQMQDINIKLEQINYTQDKEHLYPFGSNEEVEAFGQKLLDAINGYDFEEFAKYVSFPITVHVNQAVQTIETKEGFKVLGSEVIFTDEFMQSMAVAYPNFMFANAADGVMLGDGTYNIWFNKDANGEMKVVAINN